MGKHKGKKVRNKQKQLLVETRSSDVEEIREERGEEIPSLSTNTIEVVKPIEPVLENGHNGKSSVSEKRDPTFKRKRIYLKKDSLLTTLCGKDKNIEALYHVLILMILVGLGYSLLKDTVEAGKPHIDFTYYVSGFGPIKMQLFSGLVWICLKVAVLSVYVFFKLWQYTRPYGAKAVDFVFVTLFLVYSLIANYFVIAILTKYNLYPVPSLVLMVEQLRFSMKSYSFIRENAYKVLYPWHKDDTSGPAVWYRGQMSPKVGSFQQYCYFLFAPTLLYRDHYPRTKQIRWYAVIVYSLQMFSALWCTVFITINILYPQSLREQDVLHCFMLSLIMGLISLLLCNVTVLHAYMNMVAELMRFADRKFYDAWWTCTSFSSFYRKWNLLVHDWIHCYVYTDIRKALNKRFAVFVTILVSSLVHEYLLALGMGFMLPVVTMLFAGVGVFFYVLKPLANKRLSNLFVLVCLSLGMAIILSVLMLEYASRQHCPTRDGMSWFVPNLIQCYKQYNP